MYASIKAVYENGQIVFSEQPPTNEKSNVIVMFLKEDIEYIQRPNQETLNAIEDARNGNVERYTSLSAMWADLDEDE
jgi:hypothetical protein